MDDKTKFELDADDTRPAPFVYCYNHCRVHAAGWCTAGNRDKLGIWADSQEEAEAALKRMVRGLVLK